MIQTDTLLQLDPRHLESDPDNVRRDTDDDLEPLASSIRCHGLLQPIGVARQNGSYRVVYGNRRREAAILAGLAQVPCLVLEPPHHGQLVLQLLENLQRRDLNDLDKAAGLLRLRRQLAEEPDLDEREPDARVGRAVGLAPATVRRYLGLLELAPAVQALIAEGALGVTHAQHLRAVREPLRQEELGRLAVERGLSAAALGRAARLLAGQPAMAAEEAVAQGERGVEAPTRREPAVAPERLPRALKAESDEDAEADEGEDEAEPADDGPAGLSTADGHRVFRIRSVGAFADEVDRLARALHDGDLARAAAEAPDAPIQLRLTLRQLKVVVRDLEALLRCNGWGD